MGDMASDAGAPIAGEALAVQLAIPSATQDSTSGATVAPGVFRFSDLPLELQFEIWEYAIDSECDGVLPQNFFFAARGHHYRNLYKYPTCYAGFIKAASRVYNLVRHEEQFQVRRVMMSVCRLSRKYALECWKKDIEAIVITLDATNSTPNDRFWITGAKKELLGILDARIQGLISRMNAGVVAHKQVLSA